MTNFMTLNIVLFVLCLLFIYRCIYGFQTLYRRFTVELWTDYRILFCKILPQSCLVVAIHNLIVCTLYSLNTIRSWLIFFLKETTNLCHLALGASSQGSCPPVWGCWVPWCPSMCANMWRPCTTTTTCHQVQEVV